MNTDSISKYIAEHLSDKRQRHTEGVRQTAVALAEKYGADVAKAEACALFHDMFKSRSLQENDELVAEYGLDEKYKGSPNLAHSKLAAAAMQRDFGIKDEDMINAVAYHTTGRAGMSTLEKVIYIADAIEPNRDYPGVDRLRELAQEDLDAACLAGMEQSIKFVKENGGRLDQDTLEAAGFLKKQEEYMDGKKAALLAAKAIDARKGSDITILDIAEKSSFADYMVLGSGGSERQIGALCDEVEDMLARDGLLVKSIEGRKESGWILMDYGDLIVNLLTEEMRTKYNIEKVWGDCRTVPVEF
ncbi:MAG: bis(5'-nucleosyl)-tetraphosphatase (symmetrical) YqeK [Anaerovoracaceae bacterium]|jgi:ribosome silencing factor RsfS/YbeB/iojap